MILRCFKCSGCEEAMTGAWDAKMPHKEQRAREKHCWDHQLRSIWTWHWNSVKVAWNDTSPSVVHGYLCQTEIWLVLVCVFNFLGCTSPKLMEPQNRPFLRTLGAPRKKTGQTPFEFEVFFADVLLEGLSKLRVFQFQGLRFGKGLVT